MVLGHQAQDSRLKKQVTTYTKSSQNPSGYLKFIENTELLTIFSYNAAKRSLIEPVATCLVLALISPEMLTS